MKFLSFSWYVGLLLLWTQTYNSGSPGLKFSDMDKNCSLACFHTQLVTRDLETSQLPWKTRCKIPYSLSICAAFISNIFLRKDERFCARVWLPGYKDTRKAKNLQFLCNTTALCQEDILSQCLPLFWTLFIIFKLTIFYIFQFSFKNHCTCRINCPGFSRHYEWKFHFYLSLEFIRIGQLNMLLHS